MSQLIHPALDPLLALGVGVLAWRVRALSAGGAIAAAAVGWAHGAGAGRLGAGALIAFFVTSTLLSKLGKRRKDALGFEKGGTRDHWQVLANGGVSAMAALVLLVAPGNTAAQAALLGALATATADTWATEIGSVLGRNPRRIADLRPARAGESGAVTVAGTCAAAAGALLIAGMGLAGGLSADLAGAVLGAGIAGALIDSWLGATCQAMRRCAVCERITEANHCCALPTAPHSGYAWMRNDAVNAIATAAGAALAVLTALGRGIV
ncbi:MAG: DUF92 domain-containing protein [Armatimonadota bacterium]